LQYSQYRFKFYFNASHAIYLSGEMGQSHPHTWEVILNVMKVSDNFILFNEIEKMCEDFLSRFQNGFINQIEPFTTINPTLENLCGYFKEQLHEMLYEKGWLLLSIELSETPSRSYVISVSEETEARKSYFDSSTEEAMQEVVNRLAAAKIASMEQGKETSAAPDEAQEQAFQEIKKSMKKKSGGGMEKLKKRLLTKPDHSRGEKT
jgi:6-pyruvoyltetrahydropterin/6-carboxytetrahydropterin synthase